MNSSQASTQSVEAIGDDGVGIRVVFYRVEDRYAHRIEVARGVQTRVVLESIEGNNREDWPPSPPLQQLTIENRNDHRAVALLVGAAGNTHWSVSAEPDPQLRSITLDVACRLGKSAERLQSSYRIPPVAGRPPGWTMPVDIQLADPMLPAAIERESEQWLILPPLLDPPATIRWSYRIALVAVDG